MNSREDALEIDMKGKAEVADILEQYQEYLETDEAKQHLQTMKDEKAEVKELVTTLTQMDKKSEEFTELVLYGLLPYSKSKFARRVSLFPSFMNIKLFFKEFNYTDEEWNQIAIKIFNLCHTFQTEPKKLDALIKDFTSDKYSRRLQCGSITPILFCLNDEFPIVNNRTIRSYRSINLMMGYNFKLSQKLDEYIVNIGKLKVFTTQVDSDLLEDNDHLDLFCYWYDSEILSEERRQKKDEAEDESAAETEDEIKRKDFDLKEFVENTDFDDGFDFSPHSLGDPQRIRINSIIANCSKARWVLPHFQRYFDWNKVNVKELWESIFHDYYIGSFLLWDTGRNPELGIQPILGVSDDDVKPDSIILDGQQRMTSLYYAIKAPNYPLKGSKSQLYYYINFYTFFSGNNSDVIEIRASKISRDKTFRKMLFPLYELENYNVWVDDFEDFLYKEISDSEKVRKLRRIIDRKLRHTWEGFEIPYISLPESMDLSQVTDIFENLNSKGKPLSVFDLLIARLYKWQIELKKMWDSTLANYPNIQRYYKDGKIEKIPIYILQSMSLLYEKSSSAKRRDVLNIYSNIYEKSEKESDENSERDFNEDWDDISEYMNKALIKLENMRDGFGVKNERELPFISMIPVLTSLLRVIDTAQRDNKADCYQKLNVWYWSAIFTNAYSSAAESQMTMDFRDLSKWFNEDDEIPRVVKDMRREVAILELREIQSKSSAKYRGIMSLIAIAGAKDFDTGQTLEGARDNDKDHLFPKSFKFDHGSGKNANSILNMTWMSDTTNRKVKRHKKPSVYTKEFIKDKYGNDEIKFQEILETHFIDRKSYELLLSDNFEGFLSERENVILDRIKESVGYEESESGKTLITPQSPFTNRMIFIKTLKSCDESIYWLDKYFSKKGLELLNEAVEDKKLSEVKIIMASEKADYKYRGSFKHFRDELASKNISCECRVLTDSKIKSAVHDRFIISKYSAFNIPSPDIIARGQLSEITKSDNREELLKEFNSLWEESKDIIQDWNEIQKGFSNK